MKECYFLLQGLKKKGRLFGVCFSVNVIRSTNLDKI